jgi:hypothetical protein
MLPEAGQSWLIRAKDEQTILYPISFCCYLTKSPLAS